MPPPPPLLLQVLQARWRAAPAPFVLDGYPLSARALAAAKAVVIHPPTAFCRCSLLRQVHYLGGRPANDTSGVKLRFTEEPVPYSAGMVAFAAGFSIPPGKPSTLVKNTCCYSGWEPLRGFATRVHTHALGRWGPGQGRRRAWQCQQQPEPRQQQRCGSTHACRRAPDAAFILNCLFGCLPACLQRGFPGQCTPRQPRCP